MTAAQQTARDFKPRIVVRGESLFINDIPLFTGTAEQLLDEIEGLIGDAIPQLVVTPNVDQILTLASSPELQRAYRTASLRIIDGTPVQVLGRFLGARHATRITGAELLPLVVERAARRSWRIALTGGRIETVLAAAESLQRGNPGAEVVGVPFPQVRDVASPELDGIPAALRELEPDVVFVCLGAPKQEAWFLHWRSQLPRAVYVGAGAAVDFAAGERARAPQLVQALGAEWLWRVAQEPRRLGGRYFLKGPRFLGVVARSVMGRRRPETPER